MQARFSSKKEKPIEYSSSFSKLCDGAECKARFVGSAERSYDYDARHFAEAFYTQ